MVIMCSLRRLRFYHRVPVTLSSTSSRSHLLQVVTSTISSLGERILFKNSSKKETCHVISIYFANKVDSMLLQLLCQIKSGLMPTVLQDFQLMTHVEIHVPPTTTEGRVCGCIDSTVYWRSSGFWSQESTMPHPLIETGTTLGIE